MINEQTIYVVIPSYKVKKHIVNVVESIPDFVDAIVVIDDDCPEKSTQELKKLEDMDTLHILTHATNKGVGGAVISGYKYALEMRADIVVKVDGDGQMDPDKIENLVSPIISSKAGYTKGNRFRDHQILKDMPKIRLFGNSVLSFLMKACSGYWNIMDPTNGFTAISKESLDVIDLDEINEGYYFESDMLVKLNIENIVVQDVSIPARYQGEKSSLNIFRVAREFPMLMPKSILERIFYKYYLYDFNMASVYILLGIPFLLFGAIFGTVMWANGLLSNTYNSVGTVMISVLSITLGVQFLLQAINIDIASTPEKIK